MKSVLVKRRRAVRSAESSSVWIQDNKVIVADTGNYEGMFADALYKLIKTSNLGQYVQNAPVELVRISIDDEPAISGYMYEDVYVSNLPLHPELQLTRESSLTEIFMACELAYEFSQVDLGMALAIYADMNRKLYMVMDPAQLYLRMNQNGILEKPIPRPETKSPFVKYQIKTIPDISFASAELKRDEAYLASCKLADQLKQKYAAEFMLWKDPRIPWKTYAKYYPEGVVDAFRWLVDGLSNLGIEYGTKDGKTKHFV